MLQQRKQSQVEFYREFLMGRYSFEPKQFGVDMEHDEFVDVLVDAFGEAYRGQWTIDDLVIHPRDALHFCDELRRRRGWFDVPDDIILKSIMNRRKSG